VVSSANKSVELLFCRKAISLIYIRNKSGPNIYYNYSTQHTNGRHAVPNSYVLLYADSNTFFDTFLTNTFFMTGMFADT